MLHVMGARNRICSVRLGPNFEVHPVVDKNSNFWLTFKKMHAFAVFPEKYLEPCVFRGTNFTAAVNFVIQELEYKVKLLIDKSLKYKSNF